MAELEITYLFNSGFMVKIGSNLLIFDYYLNPAGIDLEKCIADSEKVWIFSSHRHADHFSPDIARWQEAVCTYFFSDDIRSERGVSRIAAQKIIFMQPYEERRTESLKVVTYGSTDEGVSFYVEVDGWRIFHAGDLNWWHWKGDTAENLQLAEAGFRAEMSRLAGLQLDIAFFPVDNRLEEYRAIGAEVFCRTVAVPQLVSMHSRGPVWVPPAEFPDGNRPVSVWCPSQAGERKKFNK